MTIVVAVASALFFFVFFFLGEGKWKTTINNVTFGTIIVYLIDATELCHFKA
jgi:hypothetical protein